MNFPLITDKANKAYVQKQITFEDAIVVLTLIGDDIVQADVQYGRWGKKEGEPVFIDDGIAVSKTVSSSDMKIIEAINALRQNDTK